MGSAKFNFMKLNDQGKVAIVAGICLIALVVVLKNVVLVPADVLSRDLIIYIIVYFGFITTNLSQDERKSCCRPAYWYLTIILVTLAIIGVYAI